MEKANATIKVDTAVNWAKAINYIPDIFTVVVYTYPEGSPKIKLGDGINKVNDLPFLSNGVTVEDDTLVL